jgi:predicted homoserine dehydrogenase-like protein
VDKALQAREAAGRPIRVAMVGAGFMGRGLANQIVNSVTGMRLVAIGNRHVDGAGRAYVEAGVEPVDAPTLGALEDAIRAGRPAVTEDALALCRSEQIDALVDVTGAVEFGARVALEAFAHGKHLILMNAEVDATSARSPDLRAPRRRHPDACDGDQPGVESTSIAT